MLINSTLSVELTCDS